MSEEQIKKQEDHCHCGGNCQCDSGECDCTDTECCDGGCGCGNHIYTDEDFDTDYTPAEQYALLADEAYKEIVKEKLKEKFRQENAEIDQVVEIAYQACLQRWKEMTDDTFEEQIWDKLDGQLSELWKK